MRISKKRYFRWILFGVVCLYLGGCYLPPGNIKKAMIKMEPIASKYFDQQMAREKLYPDQGTERRLGTALLLKNNIKSLRVWAEGKKDKPE